MLVSLSVENFRSFSSEETLSLVASKRLSGSHEDHEVPIPGTDEHALRTAVIYGANGAGKSNLFKALRFVQNMVMHARAKSASTGREAFRFAAEELGPSSFDLQLVAGGATYRYGFKVDDQQVNEEWLVKITSNGREQTLYERMTDAEGKVTIEVPRRKAGDKVAVLASLGGPQNQTFLATIRATLEEGDIDADIAAVMNWFTEGLHLIAPNESIEPIGHLLSTDAGFLDFANQFLKNASTGVDHLEVVETEITAEDLSKRFPASVVHRLLKDLEGDEDGTAVVKIGDADESLIRRKDANHFYDITVQAAHHGVRSGALSLSKESDGTRRLLQLVPALHKAGKRETVYVVDEIDRSMHPMLIWKFIESFMRSCAGRSSQLIVTTHESNLLDLDLLRRDEIWFVEKDASLSSRLYSLMDFKVRKDLEIRKHYLQGRFGAVPFLGNVDRLMDKAID